MGLELDLSEFDLTYYTLDDRGVWMPDHRAGWLEDDRDAVGFALVNRAPSAQASGVA